MGSCGGDTGLSRASYVFMAAVLFSWKKGVETSTMFMVIFMVVFDFFRAIGGFQFSEWGHFAHFVNPTPPRGDTRRARLCSTNTPLSLGAEANLHGSCVGIYRGVFMSYVHSHAAPRERGVGKRPPLAGSVPTHKFDE